MHALISYRKVFVVSLVIALLVAGVTVIPIAAAAPTPVDADGLIIVWERGFSSTARARTLERRGLRISRSSRDGSAVSVDVAPADIAALAEELSSLPGVALVEPDYRVHITTVPDDPGYSDQWAYGRIQAQDAWDVEQGEASVLVAVVDTGADLDHPDLAANLDTANDRNFTVAPTDPAYVSAEDDNGHGTHVAGIVAAQTDNGVGVAGTAPHVRILPLKAIPASGWGSAFALAEAIDYATAVGADVINLSLAFDYGQMSVLVNQAIHDATTAGVLVVAASGNSGSAGVRYPAAYPDCIAVGATTVADERAYFSTYGSGLDIVAPGGRASLQTPSAMMVLSTYTDGGYAYMEGTSMATPFVSAGAALMKSYAPTATAAQIRSALETSAKDIDAAGYDIYTGHGLMQLRNAIDLLTGTDTAPPVTTSGALASYDDVATLTLTADDGAGFGVAATYFSVDGGSLQRGVTVEVEGYGTHTVEYWSDDVVGNRETTNSNTFFVDDTLAPVTMSDAVSVYESTATITLSASDGTGSGVDDTYFSLDGAGPVSGTTLSTSEIGVHTLSFGSTDLVGNPESPATNVEFVVEGVPVVSRVYGTTRYDTAAELSRATYATGSVPTVVLASGQGYADALSASALAGVLGSPVLLTARDYLPASASAELARLGATRVLIVGGTAAVSAEVESALVDAGLDTERVQGTDRYATAAAVARRVLEESGAGSVAAVFVVRSDRFPDALAVSSLAAAQGYPVLMTRTDALVPATANAIATLGAEEVVIVGGAYAVSPDVADDLADLSGVTMVTRWEGADRYSTAATVVRNGVSRGWTGASFFGVATGANFPDALGGGVVSAALGGTMVLTAPDMLSAAASGVIDENGAGHLPIRVFGGYGAVSEQVEDELAALRFR